MSGTTEADDASRSFEMLHEGVRRWIWRQGWAELRDVQERSIPLLMAGGRDLVIAAATASGKTEAAFLPIVSRIASEGRAAGGGFEAIYVSPLRALINDQFGRIEGLCEELDVPVTKWHGDVAASVKQRAAKRPGGVLLTTPESLEAILVRRGGEAGRLFAALGHVVVDEMHAFLDAPRGRHLQSLLNRVEIAAGHRVDRVGLSATLADMRTAAAFLRPADPDAVDVLESREGHQELRLQLRGYVEPASPRAAPARGAPTDFEDVADAGDADAPAGAGEAAERGGEAMGAMVRHMFATLRGRRSLVFAGSRQRVELVTAALGEMTEAAGVPEEFHAHHGSLSREIREDAERRMKDPTRPASIVCTTTLELGIDVGHIDSVAQVGPGQTVSGMRQRIGRSGRREGHPAVMRVYVQEAELHRRMHPLDAMRPSTVQALAMLNLMLRRWNEPPVPGRLHLSTLVHQILALVAQHGGLTALQGWNRLAASRVFPELTKPLYAAVLRRMAHADVRLLEQAPDGTLLPGAEGERVIAARDFYAVFMTPEEYKVATDRGRNLGTIPVDNPVVPGQLMILGGRRWAVLEVDAARHEILVTRAYGGKPPVFGGDPAAPADEVVAEMLRVWMRDDVPAFMEATAAELLAQGRDTFVRLGLAGASVARQEDQLLLFPWVGARTQTALLLSLLRRGLEVATNGIAVTVASHQGEAVLAALRGLAGAPPPDAVELARLVPEKARSKFDHYLDEDLLSLDYASEMIDVSRLPEVAGRLADGWLQDGTG